LISRAKNQKPTLHHQRVSLSKAIFQQSVKQFFASQNAFLSDAGFAILLDLQCCSNSTISCHCNQNMIFFQEIVIDSGYYDQSSF
jgi:hypothetical protein